MPATHSLRRGPSPLCTTSPAKRKARCWQPSTRERVARQDLYRGLDEFERGTASLVVFEDVHWADEATLDLLKFLGRRIHRTRVMLAMTYRDDEVGARHPLRFVIGDFPRANTHRAPLTPLSKPAVEQLAKQAGRAIGDLYSITGGNPLFVTEALAGTDSSVPVMVRDAVLARAARLSPERARNRGAGERCPRQDGRLAVGSRRLRR